MKKNKIIYWISTGLFSALMLFSAYSYFFTPDVKAGFVHLGFPDYLRVELGFAKLLGALALILPFTPKEIKGFTYSGFAINLVSASIAHGSSGDPASAVITPLVILAILGVSYFYYKKQA